MKRLIEYTVFSGFVTACRLATWPTSRSPDLVIATTEGVVRMPSWLGITTGSPPCITDTTELVVPRSIPIILLIITFLICSAKSVQAPRRERVLRETCEREGSSRWSTGGLGRAKPAANAKAIYNLSVLLSSYLIPSV